MQHCSWSIGRSFKAQSDAASLGSLMVAVGSSALFRFSSPCTPAEVVDEITRMKIIERI
jgi:hypothetical protein